MQQGALRPLAHLQLARAYTVSGDTSKAKGAYNDFLTQLCSFPDCPGFALAFHWKDADPDVPIVRQAKAEYAKLQ